MTEAAGNAWASPRINQTTLCAVVGLSFALQLQYQKQAGVWRVNCHAGTKQVLDLTKEAGYE